MIQVRDIFGAVVDVSKPIKRTRTRTLAAPEPVESSSLVVEKPVITCSNSLISRLMSLSHQQTYLSIKRTEEEIARRISEIRKNKDEILKKAEALLTRLPNLSVLQAINLNEGGSLWQIRKFSL